MGVGKRPQAEVQPLEPAEPFGVLLTVQRIEINLGASGKSLSNVPWLFEHTVVQSVSASALLTFGATSFFLWGCPARSAVLSVSLASAPVSQHRPPPDDCRKSLQPQRARASCHYPLCSGVTGISFRDEMSLSVSLSICFSH